jgi:hypothetical protein
LIHLAEVVLILYFSESVCAMTVGLSVEVKSLLHPSLSSRPPPVFFTLSLLVDQDTCASRPSQRFSVTVTFILEVPWRSKLQGKSYHTISSNQHRKVESDKHYLLGVEEGIIQEL